MSVLPPQPADIHGRMGRAWRLDVDAIAARQRRVDGVPRELSLPSWIVFSPWAHPMWLCYLISGVSLRDTPGAPPAKYQFRGATHEVFGYAIDPDGPPLAIDERPAILQPLNFAAQLIADSDADAAARIEAAVAAVVDGRLSPDQDARAQWRALFAPSPPIAASADEC